MADNSMSYPRLRRVSFMGGKPSPRFGEDGKRMATIDPVTGKTETPLPGQPKAAPPVRSGLGRRILSGVRSQSSPTATVTDEKHLLQPDGTDKTLDSHTEESPLHPISRDQYLHPQHPIVQDHASRLQALEDHLGISKGSGGGAGGGGGNAF